MKQSLFKDQDVPFGFEGYYVKYISWEDRVEYGKAEHIEPEPEPEIPISVGNRYIQQIYGSVGENAICYGVYGNELNKVSKDIGDWTFIVDAESDIDKIEMGQDTEFHFVMLPTTIGRFDAPNVRYYDDYGNFTNPRIYCPTTNQFVAEINVPDGVTIVVLPDMVERYTERYPQHTVIAATNILKIKEYLNLIIRLGREDKRLSILNVPYPINPEIGEYGYIYNCLVSEDNACLVGNDGDGISLIDEEGFTFVQNIELVGRWVQFSPDCMNFAGISDWGLLRTYMTFPADYNPQGQAFPYYVRFNEIRMKGRIYFDEIRKDYGSGQYPEYLWCNEEDVDFYTEQCEGTGITVLSVQGGGWAGSFSDDQ